MAMVWISVAEMGDVVLGLERGIETLRAARSSLRSTLDRFDLDTSRTAVIGWSVDWAVDELPGVRRRLAMAQALEGSRPGWPAGAVQLDEATVSVVSPELALKQGREAATALRDGDGRPDDTLIDQIRASMEDPYFASGFASQLTTAELAAVVTRLSYERVTVGRGTSEEEAAAANGWYSRLIVGLANTMGTATRATGDLAVPPGYAQQWVNEITQQVDAYLYPDSTGTREHANALSLLVTSGRWDATFLSTVAGGVFEYEHSYADGDKEALWLDRGAWAETSPQGVFDASGRQVRDPLEALVAGLGNNPAAAQAFFEAGPRATVRIDGADLQVSERLRYFVQERSWDYERVPGRSFGAALEAATTQLRNGQESGRVSAELASQSIALIGGWTGHGAHDDVGPSGLVSPANAGWEMPAGMRASVARILASYGADVHRVVLEDNDHLTEQVWTMTGSGPLFPDEMPYGARMELDLINPIVRTLGQDKDDFAPFLAGVFQAGNLRIDTGLKRAMEQQTLTNAGALLLTGSILDDASPAITTAASSVGWALDTAYGGDRADEAVKKKQAEAAAAALSMVSSMPFVPEIKPEWVKWGVDQAKDHYVDEMKDSAPTDARATYNKLDSQARELLRDNVANLLLRNDYFSADAIADAAEHGTIVTPPPAGAIVTSSAGEKAFDTSSAEYETWVNTGAMGTFLEESVVGVYASEWGSVQ